MPDLERLAWFITDFADQAVVLPLAFLVAVFLYAFGWRRGALVWTTIVVGTFGFMLLLKIAFGACGGYLTGGQIESPSGHTAAAGVIYGSLFAFLAEAVFGRTVLTVIGIFAIVTVVGVSRVMLGAHTIPEAVVGAIVGAFAALVMARGVGPLQTRSLPVLALIPLCAILFLFHGLHLQAERRIQHFAHWFSPFEVCRRYDAETNRPPVTLAALPRRTPLEGSESWALRR